MKPITVSEIDAYVSAKFVPKREISLSDSSESHAVDQ
jgi:hypothetical protein